MLRYTFIEHPLSYTLAHIKNHIPGAMEAYAVFCNTDKELIFQSFINDKVEKLPLKNKVHLLQKFRKGKTPHSWIRKDMLYFLELEQTKKKKIQQLSLEDEVDNDYLCLKFISPFDRLFDVLIIKISNAGMFGMASGAKITTHQKSTVGQILHNTFNARIKEEFNNLETHSLVLNSLKNQKLALDNTKQENELLKTNYKKSLLHFMNSLTTQINNEMGLSVALSEEAKEFLTNKLTDLENIERTIRAAVHMAMNLTLNSSSTLLIEPEHILIEEKKQIESAVYKNDKYSNIVEMLDKYEEAAAKAHNREWKINGNTVAEICEITPSAITFNLKKYKKSVNILLERYDDKWPLLRTYFKPLKNIIEAGNQSFQSSLTA